MAVVAGDPMKIFVLEVRTIVWDRAPFQPRARSMAAPAELPHTRGILLGYRKRRAKHRVACRLRHHTPHPLKMLLMLTGVVRIGTLRSCRVIDILAIAVAINTQLCRLECVAPWIGLRTR